MAVNYIHTVEPWGRAPSRRTTITATPAKSAYEIAEPATFPQLVHPEEQEALTQLIGKVLDSILELDPDESTPMLRYEFLQRVQSAAQLLVCGWGGPLNVYAAFADADERAVNLVARNTLTARRLNIEVFVDSEEIEIQATPGTVAKPSVRHRIPGAELAARIREIR